MEYQLVGQWLVVFFALYLAGVPLAAVLHPEQSTVGTPAALAISLLVVGVSTYWIGQVLFGPAAVVGAVVILLCCSVLAYRRTENLPTLRSLRGPLTVFTIAFLGMVAIRAVDPAIHPSGGEKFLDYGLLRSLFRTTQLPPQDVWFAGEPVQYYYGGHLLSASVSLLTGTAPQYGYNLALAAWYGALVTGVYGLARLLRAQTGGSGRRAGIAGAGLVGVASNLQPAVRTVLWWLPESASTAVAQTLGVPVAGLARSPQHFSYWNASRVIQTIPSDPDSPLIPTEFPLFSFLNGDLHAHMISPLFLVLVATLCLSYYQASDDDRRRWGVLVTIGICSGWIGLTNTWSFPTSLGLLFLTVLFSEAPGTRFSKQTVLNRLPDSVLPDRTVSSSVADWWRTERPQWLAELGAIVSRWLHALWVVTLAGLIGIVSVAPFWLSSVSSREIATTAVRTPYGPLFVVHGAFLLLFGLLAFRVDTVRSVLVRQPVATGLFGGLLGVLLLTGWFPALVLLGPIVGLVWYQLRTAGENEERSRPTSGFTGVLVLAGAAIVLLVELLYVKEEAGIHRFNTVFKAYMQVWVLWSIAGGVAIAWLWDRQRSVWRPATRLLVAVLVVSTAIYPTLALTEHVTEPKIGGTHEEPTLDALVVLEQHPDERAAIRWLNDRDGQPVIASAPGTQIYRWTSAEATLTGAATIAGWSHEIGYRNRSIYEERVADVDTLYTGSPTAAQKILDRYDVQYVYVGPNEHERYDSIRIDELDSVTPRSFGNVTIYEVES